MNLAHVRTFATVARMGHVTRAAAVLHRTQPAISNQIKEMESELGLVLFDRVGRRVVLTAEGRAFLPEAERLLRESERTEEAVREIRGLSRGSLSVGASTTPGIYLVPDLLGAFRRRFPGVGLSLRIGNSSQVYQWVTENAVDVGFAGAPRRDPELTTRRFAEDRIVCVGRPGDAAARRGRDLASVTFVVREAGSATGDLVEKALHKLGVPPANLLEVSEPETLKRLVAAGVGLGAMSEHGLRWEFQAKRLVPVALAGFPIRRPLFLVTHRERTPGPILTAFLEEAARG